MALKNCPICGAASLENRTGEFVTTIADSAGREHKLSVPNVGWQHCPDCGEDVLEHDASTAIEAAHRLALRLLTPVEIKELRQRLGKSQKEMSELLGIGLKTYSRWERGVFIQSESFDRYLRLLYVEANVRMLETINGEKHAEQVASARRLFDYIPDPSVFAATSVEFAALLQRGPFCVGVRA